MGKGAETDDKNDKDDASIKESSDMNEDETDTKHEEEVPVVNYKSSESLEEEVDEEIPEEIENEDETVVPNLSIDETASKLSEISLEENKTNDINTEKEEIEIQKEKEIGECDSEKEKECNNQAETSKHDPVVIETKTNENSEENLHKKEDDEIHTDDKESDMSVASNSSIVKEDNDDVNESEIGGEEPTEDMMEEPKVIMNREEEERDSPKITVISTIDLDKPQVNGNVTPPLTGRKFIEVTNDINTEK